MYLTYRTLYIVIQALHEVGEIFMRNYVELPNNSGRLTIGSKVRLSRFSQDVWVVSYGWYAWGNNRRTLGWYFFNTSGQIKPLQETDLYDIYCIEPGQPCEPELNDMM